MSVRIEAPFVHIEQGLRQSHIWTAGSVDTGWGRLIPYIDQNYRLLTKDAKTAVKTFVKAARQRLSEMGDCLGVRYDVDDASPGVINPALILSPYRGGELYLLLLPNPDFDHSNPFAGTSLIVNMSCPEEGIDGFVVDSLSEISVVPDEKRVTFVGDVFGLPDSRVSLKARDEDGTSSRVTLRVEGDLSIRKPL